MVLKPNDGVTELVIMPRRAFGPEMLRKFSVWNRLREASLKVLMVVSSYEYVSPTLLNDRPSA